MPQFIEYGCYKHMLGKRLTYIHSPHSVFLPQWINRLVYATHICYIWPNSAAKNRPQTLLKCNIYSVGSMEQTLAVSHL